MRTVLAKKSQSMGFIYNISQNPTDFCFTSEIEYELWEQHTVNNQESIIESPDNEPLNSTNSNSVETENITSTTPVNNPKAS
jgi:hypothetical protein